MIWIVAYRGQGEQTGQLAASGRAAAIVAAIAMIESGLEVLRITDRSERRSVTAEEIRRVRELSHAPAIKSMFGIRNELPVGQT